MAIVKHNSSKNARYEDVLEYYTCRHREDSRTGHYEPILDEYGLMQTRSNCAALYLTADGRRLRRSGGRPPAAAPTCVTARTTSAATARATNISSVIRRRIGTSYPWTTF